jgi:hypothetical protein
MRYGVTTDFLASSSVHSNLSCAGYGACSIQSDNYNPTIASVWLAPRVRGWASLLFEHGFWVSRQSKFSNDQIENATRSNGSGTDLISDQGILQALLCCM